MADSVPGDATLEAVRKRFMQSEQELAEAAGALRGLLKSSEQLDAARSDLRRTTDAVTAMQTSTAEACAVLVRTATDLRTATELLGKTEPAEVMRRVEDLSGRLGEVERTIGRQSDALAQMVSAQEQTRVAARETSAAVGRLVSLTTEPRSQIIEALERAARERSEEA